MRTGSWVGVITATVLLLAAPARAATVQQRVAMSDGVELQTTLTTPDARVPRPTVVEFSPYGTGTSTFDAGPAFNHLLVQIRGTGDSDGTFDALGPRTQQDVADTLRWACGQPWSDGALALNGFSASAITVYNALHLHLPCVRAAVLKSGTFELYRDLLVPGGVSNLVPGGVVLAQISGTAAGQSLARKPQNAPAAILNGLTTGIEELRHPALDAWWRERGFRGDVNHLPVLMVAGFFDVESRGAFEAYRALKGDGAHLIVIGAHDQHPAGTDGGLAEMRAWVDHYVRGVGNGVQDHPRVQLWMADGDRKAYVAGTGVVRRDAADWPVPHTRWRAFALSAARSGTASSINDGTLAARADAAPTQQAYPSAASVPTMTDVPNAAIVDAMGASALTDGFPALSDMRLAEPLGLTYTSAPLAKDLVSAGPGALDLQFATTAPTGAIWAVVSDVSPDGVAHPLTVGRLSTDFPGVDAARSLRQGRTIVQPYGRYDVQRPAAPGVTRRYQVELWPLGNRFRKGHRIRLHLVGASAASPLAQPGLDLVTVGGPQPSRLLLPVLPAG